MLILTAYRGILMGNPPIAARAKGGAHIDNVEERALRPNILLTLEGSGQDYSHQGPTGLMDAGVKITARADTAQAAGELGEMIRDLLQNWRGTIFDCWIQMTEHENSASGYDGGAKVFTCTHEFTSFYRKVT